MPRDPILAMKMRTKMAEFDRLIEPLVGVMKTGGLDSEQVKLFGESARAHERFTARIGYGEFLLGTNEPTMLDIYCAPFYEMLVQWSTIQSMA